MKKLIYIILAAFVLINTACQKDYLDVKSPSAVDEDFVFASSDEAYKVLAGCYNEYHHANYYQFYEAQVVGSDAEHFGEPYASQQRNNVAYLFDEDIPINYPRAVDAWAQFYKIINRCNIMTQAIEQKEDYQSAVASGTVNDWTQLYGEATAFRGWLYNLLIYYFGDVPYFDVPVYSTAQTDTTGLTSRFTIWDNEIAHLKAAEPLMYRVGEGGMTAERFTRTFVQGLIGQMAQWAGGYSLIRTDFDYGNVQFEQKGTEKWNAVYARRTDHETYHRIAVDYLKKLIDNPGSVHLITTDERPGIDNPFQRNWQYTMDLEVSPESIWEYPYVRAHGNSEWPYAMGRPSGGGSAGSFPNKGYGQARFYTTFYYGDYDPKDKRRDVTVGITANSGSCSERLISFVPGNREKGGFCANKTDESRMADPYTIKQRSSGVNWVIMRMADIKLLLAEAYADLGEDGNAKTQLTEVRSRAFNDEDQTEKVTNYISSLSGESLKDAIQDERKFELAGEGYHRADLIRTGRFPDKIKRLRDNETAMVNDLKSKGYHTFENGNTISNYIWTKFVNMADYGIDHMLTTDCTVSEDDPAYPVLHPGWRGNCDLWGSEGFTAESGERNLALKGVFHYIDPNGAEAAALEADGYVKTNWGADIIANEGQYSTDIFKGYPDEYYNAGVPPRYIYPLSTETISKSNGLISNGYGWPQE